MRTVGSRRLNSEELNVELWKFPDEGALGEEALKTYRARKIAVQLYLKGATEKKIKKEAGIGLSQTYRLITERCLAVHPSDGEVWGWRGLIKGVRINPYQRKKKVVIDKFGLGGAGALNDLFNEFPSFREDFNKRILKPIQSDRLGEAKKTARDHWQWFLDTLREIYKKREFAAETRWPFNTQNQGYVTVCRYIKRLYNENPERAALLVGGPDNQKKMESGDGTNRPVSRLFQRVEMDGHKLDGRFCVLLPQMDGSYLKKIVHRIWVTVILEVTSRAVLGYHLSMRREVSKYDVLRAIKCALTKWDKPPLTFDDNAYRPRANLPSGHSEKFTGVCWDETSVDGALAETCRHIKEKLKDVTGSVLLEPGNSFAVKRLLTEGGALPYGNLT